MNSLEGLTRTVGLRRLVWTERQSFKLVRRRFAAAVAEGRKGTTTAADRTSLAHSLHVTGAISSPSHLAVCTPMAKVGSPTFIRGDGVVRGAGDGVTGLPMSPGFALGLGGRARGLTSRALRQRCSCRAFPSCVRSRRRAEPVSLKRSCAWGRAPLRGPQALRV